MEIKGKLKEINQILNYAKLNGKSVRNEVYKAIGRKQLTAEEIKKRKPIDKITNKSTRKKFNKKKKDKYMNFDSSVSMVEEILNHKCYVRQKNKRPLTSKI